MLKYKGIVFDDYTIGEYGVWSQVCDECARKHSMPRNLLDENGGGICGVKGCWNEADNYIDFPYGEFEIEEGEEGGSDANE